MPILPPTPTALQGLEETDLVRLAQQGRHDAFSELMRQHYSSSFKLALSILRDRPEAEDEVQNAYWKAYRHIGQFQLESRFSTWMTRIVVNQCLMRLRQSRRARFLFLDECPPGGERGGMELVDPAGTPETSTGMQQVGQVLRQEVRRIPPMLRNVFVLREMDQLPMDEVANRLGISVAAAKSRLLRARTELRNRMEKHCGRAGHATLTA